MNSHDHQNPESFVNQVDAAAEAIASQCPTCGAVPTPIPALGTRWILGIDHEPGCSEFISDDELPTVAVQPRLSSE